jgi:hypothetical protein
MRNGKPVFRVDKLAMKFHMPQSEAVGDSLASVGAAVEELYAAVEKLGGAIRLKEMAVHPGDYDGILEVVTELRELFEHLAEHSQEASSALWQLSDMIASKLEYPDRK